MDEDFKKKGNGVINKKQGDEEVPCHYSCSFSLIPSPKVPKALCTAFSL